MRVFCFILSLLSLAATLPAQANGGVPLFFQVDKNNIQVLPQRFEYNLVDEDNLKIGDIDIDPTSFGFQIAPSTKFPGKYRARFVWPAALLREGSLLIKDNAGKAVWVMNVNRKNTRLYTPKTPSGEATSTTPQGSRPQLAEIVVDQLNPSLVEDMKYFPFMNFCISRTNQDTRIYLCSKEVYLATKDDRLTVRSRSLGKRAPFVEINGKNVGNQGIIFLNDESENIGFRAATQSGAILEVETRMKSVDFKDVVLSEDKKSLILTASGTEPVNEDLVKRLNEDEWQIRLDVERPILYLKGEGGIPMRQEFYIKGNPPVENARPNLDKGSFNRIYKPTVELHGDIPAGTSVGSNSPEDKVEKIDDGRFRWIVNKIQMGETTRHFLRVNHGNDSYLAGYDIYRDFPFEGGLGGTYWTPAGQLYTNLSATWWIENFMGSSASWARLHWGLQLKESLPLTKKNNEPNMNITRLEVIWRAQAGFHFQDRTWGLLLPYEMIRGSGLSTSSFGLGAFYSDRAPARYRKRFHWYDLRFSYLPAGSGGDIKLKSALQLNALAYYHANKRLSWNYGLGLNQYSFDPGESKMQFQVLGGANYRF